MDEAARKIQQMQPKIAFHIMQGRHAWTAGQIYLKNLVHALRQVYAGEVALSLLAPAAQRDTQEYVRSLKATEVILYPSPQRWTPLWAINGLIKRLLKHDIVMENVLKEHGIDILFGPTLVYKYPKIATLSWLPDFQHVRLPDMFSKAERLFHDRVFLQCAKSATRIILMTEAVRRDFQSFAPMYSHKARVLHPVSYIPKSVYNRNLKKILKLYHLPEKFVYLPNQFWKHKNHEMVFKVVKILKGRGIKVLLVCTGNPVDFRHPTYFDDLIQKISQWKIQDQVKYLGLIPHEHVLLLMRQSICVLNPSLFEGWGYTVDEARSVGKQVLVSDIPPHREQNPPKATFFSPHDREELGEKLSILWNDTAPGPDLDLESKAQQTLPQRVHAYAESFISVARESVKG